MEFYLFQTKWIIHDRERCTYYGAGVSSYYRGICILELSMRRGTAFQSLDRV